MPGPTRWPSSTGGRVGEANALKAVNASQQAQLDEMMRTRDRQGAGAETARARTGRESQRQARGAPPQGKLTMPRWLDHGATPPVPLPATVDDALAHLTHVLGHACYEPSCIPAEVQEQDSDWAIRIRIADVRGQVRLTLGM